MRTLFLPVIAALLLLAAPASAYQCPKVVAEIDARLAEATGLSDVARAGINALRNQGERLHNDGQHGAAMSKVNAAINALDAVQK